MDIVVSNVFWAEKMIAKIDSTPKRTCDVSEPHPYPYFVTRPSFVKKIVGGHEYYRFLCFLGREIDSYYYLND